MICVRTTTNKIRVGDRVRVYAGDPVETVTRALYKIQNADSPFNGADWFFETDIRNKENGQPWCTWPGGQIEVLFSSDEEIAERILEVLAPFDPETLLEVRNGLCAQCGRINCERHQ